MKIIRTDNYQEMAKAAGDIIAEQIKKKPDSTLGLATGETPVAIYRLLAEKYACNEIDFSQIKTVNLDEYVGVDKDDTASYYYFMKKNLWSRVNIKKENAVIPDGNCKYPDMECKSYEDKIRQFGGIDLQLLGIGINGHIGFNEPGEELICDTHKTRLTSSTRTANARFFKAADMVPEYAVTMGIRTIMNAKKILLVASGSGKRQALKQMLSRKITTNCPATLLLLHPDLTIIADRDALEESEEE